MALLAQILGLDHRGKQVILRKMANALLVTDSNGHVRFADGDEVAIKVRPMEMVPGDVLDSVFGLISNQDCPRPEWRTITRDALLSVFQAAIDTSVTEQITLALSDTVVSAKIAALTETYKVGDWKMRLDTDRPANWFRCGERFSATLYPELATLLGSDTVPDFRGDIIRQYEPGNALLPVAGTGTLYTSSTTVNPINFTCVNFLIYGGLPV